jgi:hypothetical protein
MLARVVAGTNITPGRFPANLLILVAPFAVGFSTYIITVGQIPA